MIVGALVSLGAVACLVSLFSEVSSNPGIVVLGPFLSGFFTVVVAYTLPSGIPSLTVISALSPLIVVVEPISLPFLSNSLTVVVVPSGMPLPTDTVTFCPFFPARLVRSVSITGFFGLTLMVTTGFVILVELSEYVPLILWVNTPTVSNAPALSVFGAAPFHFKVGFCLSFSPSVISTNLSISFNSGNLSPTVVLMVLPVIGCSSASVVTLTLTLRVVTWPEPSSEVIVTCFLFMSLVTVISSDESGSLSLPVPCLVIEGFVKPEMLNFSI